MIFSPFLSMKMAANYESKHLGVYVLSTENYLNNFYPDIQSVLELYYSLAAVNAELNESGKLLLIFTILYYFGLVSFESEDLWSRVFLKQIWKNLASRMNKMQNGNRSSRPE